MSFLLTPRVLGSAALLGFAAYALPRFSSFKTTGVENIEKRHTAAGGSPTHVPAGGSKLGDSYDGRGRQMEEKGVGSVHFQQNFADQKAAGTHSVKKKLNEAVHGHEGGKGQ